MRERIKLAWRGRGLQAMAFKAWGQEYEMMVEMGAAEPPPPFVVDGDMATMILRGPLAHHHHWCFDSYEDFLNRAKAAFADGTTKRVVLLADSPGGDVDGCFETVRAIRGLMKATGKPFWVYCDSMAASAAYALACAADRIVIPSTGCVGSIGIIEALCEQTAADEAMGVNWELFTSGEYKASGNPHVPISKATRANMQAQVDQMAEVFFELVSEMRGLSVEKIRGLQARMLYGEAAVTEGLADELGTWPTVAQGAGSDRRNVAQAKVKGHGMKASYLRHMLRSLAESEGDEVGENEKKHAKNFLKMLDEGEPDDGAPPEKKKEEPEKKEVKKAEGEGEGEGESKKAEGEGEGKKAESHKAEGEGEGKKAESRKAEGEGEGHKAEAHRHAEASSSLGMAARLQALENETAARKAAERRQTLMATRQDLSDEVRAWLDTQPLDVVESAVKKLPKGPNRSNKLAAVAEAGFVRGARGEGQGEGEIDMRDLQGRDGLRGLSEEEFVNRKMGASTQGTGIRRVGKSLELGHMTPAEARAHLAKLDKASEQAAGRDK